jgi:predicted hydrocarbon binding protein
MEYVAVAREGEACEKKGEEGKCLEVL